MARHIRTVGGDLDRRYRMGQRGYITGGKASRTLCGAPTTQHDMSRASAAHVVKYAGLKPEWSADLCPACRAHAGLA